MKAIIREEKRQKIVRSAEIYGKKIIQYKMYEIWNPSPKLALTLSTSWFVNKIVLKYNPIVFLMSPNCSRIPMGSWWSTCWSATLCTLWCNVDGKSRNCFFSSPDFPTHLHGTSETCTHNCNGRSQPLASPVDFILQLPTSICKFDCRDQSFLKQVQFNLLSSVPGIWHL